jgi:hypothetical protein
MKRTGHCLCGAVTYAIQGPETWACHCHCDSCRRQTASPVTTFLGIPLARFQWTGAAPKTFASSPGVTRSFCATCGTPMAFQADRYAGEIHLYAATLTNPQDFAPRFHVHHHEHLPWLSIDDDLPRYAGFAAT